MQLSFPSLPSDPATGTLPALNPSTDGIAVATPAPTTGMPANTLAGFAQLLAAFGQPVAATANPADIAADEVAAESPENPLMAATATSVSGSGTATAWTTLQAALQNNAPVLCGTPQIPGQGGQSAAATSPRGKRSLIEESDAQALAMATTTNVAAGALPSPTDGAVSSGTPETIAPARAFAAYNAKSLSGRALLSATVPATTSPDAAVGATGNKSTLGAPNQFEASGPLANAGQEGGNAPTDCSLADAGTGSNPASSGLQDSPQASSVNGLQPEPTGPSIASVATTGQNSDHLPLPTGLDAMVQQNFNAAAAQSLSTGEGAGLLPEKIAASVAALLDRNASAIKGSPKSFVPTSAKGLTQSDPAFGIGVAERPLTMPVGSTLAHQNVPETAAVASALTATESRQQTDAMPPPVALTSTAHRAVEAVLSVTDRFAARDQHSVNLQFSVGGTDLNVRVELRAGEVHTTFRTDSAELRAALSSEWQAITGQNQGDRSSRLAPPVFTANNQGGTSFSGEGAPRQQNQEQRANGDTAARNFSNQTRATSSTTSSAVVAAPASRSVSANSVHLHTLA
jgi:hypothetical protein